MSHFRADDCHCRGDLRSYIAFEIWPIMSVFDHDCVEAGILVCASLFDCNSGYRGYVKLIRMGAGQRLKVKYPDHGSSRAEEGFHGFLLAHKQWLLRQDIAVSLRVYGFLETFRLDCGLVPLACGRLSLTRGGQVRHLNGDDSFFISIPSHAASISAISSVKPSNSHRNKAIGTLPFFHK
jgi:hypothetical protein